MLRTVRFGSLFAALLGFVPPLTAGEARERDPARLLLAQGLTAYIEYDGLDAHAGAWSQTAAYSLLNRTPAGAMIADLTEQVLGECLRNTHGSTINGYEAASLVEHLFRNGFILASYESAPTVLILPGAGREAVRDRFDRLLRMYTTARDEEIHQPLVIRERRILEAWPKPEPALREPELIRTGGGSDTVPPAAVPPIAHFQPPFDSPPTPPSEAPPGDVPVAAPASLTPETTPAAPAEVQSAVPAGAVPSEAPAFPSPPFSAAAVPAAVSEALLGPVPPPRTPKLPPPAHPSEYLKAAIELLEKGDARASDYFKAANDYRDMLSPAEQRTLDGNLAERPEASVPALAKLDGILPAGGLFPEVKLGPVASFSWWFEGEDLVLVLGPGRLQADSVLDAHEGKRPTAAVHPARLALMQDAGLARFVPTGLFFHEKPKELAEEFLPYRPRFLLGDAEEKASSESDAGWPASVAGLWGFQDKALVLDLRIAAPEPRHGWSALFDQPAFAKNALPPIPAEVGTFAVVSVDASKLVDFLGSASSPSRGMRAWIEATTQAVALLTGQKLKEHLLTQLGPVWAFYGLPPTGRKAETHAKLAAWPMLLAGVRDVGALGQSLDVLAARFNQAMCAAERAAERRPVEPILKLDPLAAPERGYALSAPSGLVTWMHGGMEPTLRLGRSFLDVGVNRTSTLRALAPESAPRRQWAPTGDLAAALASLPDKLTLLAVGEALGSGLPGLIEDLPMLVQQFANMADDADPDHVDASDVLASIGLPKPGGFRIHVTPGQVPKAEDLEPFLFPSVLAGWVDERGLRVICREAIPFAGLGPYLTFSTRVELGGEGKATRKLFLGLAAKLPNDDAKDEANGNNAAENPPTPPDDPKPEAHWVPLFNGRDLTGWYTFLQKHGKNSDPDRVITIEDGTIHLYKHAKDFDNVVMGYIGTEKEYGNYHFRVQYRWGEKKFQPRYALKRDAGLYYHITGPDAVWPRSLQYQVEQTNVGDLIALYGMQLDTWIDAKSRDEKVVRFLDPSQGGEPRILGGKGIAYQGHLAGEFEVEGWNTAEIVAKGDTTTHVLNGKVVNRGTKIRFVNPDKPDDVKPLSRGRIALEIEAAEIFFRNVEIRSLDEPE
jgi:hypothetical protein